ncbi:hypothetical protein QN412_24775, partial [Pseudomonas sp. RTB3]
RGLGDVYKRQFLPLSIQKIKTPSSLLTLDNSLIYKEFSVSSAPEEVLIIERFDGASTPNFTNLSHR